MDSIGAEATFKVASVLRDTISKEYVSATRENGHKWGSENLASNVHARKGTKYSYVDVNSDGMEESWERKPNVGYASFHEFGTGVYGPRKKPIRPLSSGGKLVFTNRRGARPITLRSGERVMLKPGERFELDEVQGMRPSKPITKGVLKFLSRNSNVSGKVFDRKR